MASELGHSSILEILLSSRADLEAKDDYGDPVERLERLLAEA